MFETGKTKGKGAEMSSDTPRYRNGAWLRKKYWDEGWSIAEIAEECEVGGTTVRDWMDRHGIDRRTTSEAMSNIFNIGPDNPLRDAEWVREKYCDERCSTSEIAEKCGVSQPTVTDWMDRHGIARRSTSEAMDEVHGIADDSALRDGKWLRERYWSDRQSISEIAEECGVSYSAVREWMERHGIARRSQSDAQYISPDSPLRDAEWVREKYWCRWESTNEIAEECGVSSSTVRDWMERHGIEGRSVSKALSVPSASPLRDAEWLREKYFEDGLNLAEIAERCGVVHSTVRAWMGRHEIERRSVAGENHPNWNGGHERYGSGWNESKRERVRERDGNVCRHPGCDITNAEHRDRYGEALHVHHLIKARDIDNPEERNAVENLVTLCREHHWKWEQISDLGIRPQLAFKEEGGADA